MCSNNQLAVLSSPSISDNYKLLRAIIDQLHLYHWSQTSCWKYESLLSAQKWMTMELWSNSNHIVIRWLSHSFADPSFMSEWQLLLWVWWCCCFKETRGKCKFLSYLCFGIEIQLKGRYYAMLYSGLRVESKKEVLKLL